MMKIFALLFGLLALSDPTDISRINGLKKQAEKSFLEGNYPGAINYYRTLIDSMSVKDDELYFNLAHAYYKSGDTTNARTYYSQSSTAEQKQIKTISYQQLGVLAKEGGQLEESLSYLKASIKADPTNIDAQYDYEVVKKLLKEQQEQQQQDQENQENKDEENKEENEDQEKKDQEGEQQEGEEQSDEEKEQQEQKPDEKDKKEEGKEQEQKEEGQEEQSEEEQDPKDMSTQQKLEEMNISEEKAQMILEAMRNSEIQYLQQQKRKATKRPKTGKPDW
ncbi:MAG: hypothetical protein ACJAZM_000700 [Cyclobacteriaceae bacterium]|jgi:Ca-activated chloride channel family protein